MLLSTETRCAHLMEMSSPFRTRTERNGALYITENSLAILPFDIFYKIIKKIIHEYKQTSTEIKFLKAS